MHHCYSVSVFGVNLSKQEPHPTHFWLLCPCSDIVSDLQLTEMQCSLAADIAAVAEGQVTYHSSKRLPYGGLNLDRHLQTLLDKQGTKCTSLHALRKLKEACTRVPDPGMNAAEVTVLRWHAHTVLRRGDALAAGVTARVEVQDLPISK